MGDFATEELPQLDALKNAGWNVEAFYGGSTVRCDPTTDPKCKPSPDRARVDQALKNAKSSFTADQIQEDSAANFKKALKNALQGDPAAGIAPLASGDHLFLDVVTHGDRSGFCSSTDYVLYGDKELNQLLKALKDKGVSIGYSASHCFSGGGVEHWSQYGCVVSIASATTVGLEGNPQITELLDHTDVTGKPVPPQDAKVTMEDLFLARLFSRNSMVEYRVPEISGFTPGADLANKLTEQLFPGDKYSLQNNFMFDKYFYRESDSPSLCTNGCCDDEANAAMNIYSNNLKDSEGLLEATDAETMKGLIQRFYGEPIDLQGLSGPSFLSDTQNLLSQYEKDAADFRAKAVRQKDDGLKIGAAHWDPYEPDMKGIGVPGFDADMAASMDEKLKPVLSLAPLPNGKLLDPGQFYQQFLSPSGVGMHAKDIYNGYISRLFKEPDPHPKDRRQKTPVQLAMDQKDQIIAQIQQRLNEAADRTMKSDPSIPGTLKEYVDLNFSFNDRLIPLQAKTNTLIQRLSGHFAAVEAKLYNNYKTHLETSSSLTPKEQADKAQLESCSNFRLN